MSKPKKTKRAAKNATPVAEERADREATPASEVRADQEASTESVARADEKATAKRKARAVPHGSADDDTRAECPTPSEQKTRAETEAPTEASAPRTPPQDRLGLRMKVRMFYDLQRLRLQSGGRTKPQAEGADIQLHEIDVHILERRSAELHLAERHALRDVSDHLSGIGFYKAVLSDKVRFRGIGPTMAGVILGEFDIGRQDTPSKMWAFAGLAPVEARRCKACHTVCVATDDGMWKHQIFAKKRGASEPTEAEPPKKSKCAQMIDISLTYPSGKSRRPVAGEKLPYNAWLRTKLVGVLGPVLLKSDSPWRKHYDEYKHRKITAGWGRNDGHRHQAAIRYMVKMLLLEIWREWRTFLELPVRDSYHVAKQGGHTGHGAPIPPVNAQTTHVPEIDPEVEAELAVLDEVA